MATTLKGGFYEYAIAGVAATTGGAIASIANPEGIPVFITRCVLYRTTPSTGAANADIGVGSSATTSYDTLLDGVDVGAAAGAADNIVNKGTNGKEGLLWAAANFVNVTGSATTAGLVGKLLISYVRLTD